MKLILLKSAQKELDGLSDAIVLQLSQKIFKLSENPYPAGYKKLGGGKGFRVRSGDYRIIYSIDRKNKTIYVTKIGHRREIYKEK